MSNKKRAWIIAVVVFLFAGPAAAYYSFREDPQIAKVKSLGRQLRQLEGEARQQAWQEIQQTYEAMGPEKRIQLEMQRRGGGEPGGRDKRMDDLFALPEKERKAKLQEEIKKDEKNAKAFEAEQAKQAAAAANGGGTIGGAGGQNGQGGPGRGGPGGGRGGFGGRDPQQARLRLDFQSSASRAKRAEYTREKQDARVQMGLPPQTPRGAWGGGRGGGGGGGGKGGR